MGAYAVEYITSSSQSQRGYYEISLQIGYRRTAEQIQAVVNATSTEALPSLLEAALDEERSELAVRIGYWGQDSRARVEEIVAEIRRDFPSVPIIATGGPAEESILRTIRAGANAVTYTPPVTGALFSQIMNRYRESGQESENLDGETV